MPSKLPMLVALRGDDDYALFLCKLCAAEKLSGGNALAEFAIAELAKRHKIPVPPRAPRPGGKRTGAGRKPKA